MIAIRASHIQYCYQRLNNILFRRNVYNRVQLAEVVALSQEILSQYSLYDSTVLVLCQHHYILGEFSIVIALCTQQRRTVHWIGEITDRISSQVVLLQDRLVYQIDAQVDQPGLCIEHRHVCTRREARQLHARCRLVEVPNIADKMR